MPATVDFVEGTDVAEPFTNGTVMVAAVDCVAGATGAVVAGAFTTISRAGAAVVVVTGGIVVVDVVVVVGTAVMVMVTAPVVAGL